MTETEILDLGRLARIRLSDTEVGAFSKDIDAILAYVGTINSLVTPSDLEKVVGPVHNVFRQDEVTNTPGEYTEALIAQMPDTKGEFLRVKKILNPTE